MTGRAARLAAVGLLATATLALAADEVDRDLARAEAELDAGRPAAAERLYRSVIAREPGLADAWYGLAGALEAGGRPDEAVEVLREAGQGLASSGRLAEATRYLERAVAIAPARTDTRVALGLLLQQRQRYAGSLIHLERAWSGGATDDRTGLLLAAALWETGRLDDAERLYRRLVGGGSATSPAGATSLGALLVWRGRYADALPYLESAARRDPDSLPVALDLARALEGAGETSRAIEAYRAALALDAELAEPHYRLGLLLRDAGRPDESREHLATFRRLHEAEQRDAHERGLERARLDRGWRLIDDGRLQAAADHFGALPGSPERAAGLATALAALGRQREAIRLLEHAIPRYPERHDLRLLLGRLQLSGGTSP